MRNSIIALFVLIWLSALAAEHFPTPQLPFAPLSYICYQATGSIVIDGKMEEADWLKAPWTEDFTDIEGNLKPQPFYQTRVKILWDDKGMYFFAWMEEEHIWAKLTERDAVIFYDNDFEIFIDPNGDTHEYYELEINALGTLWDLFLIKPYRDEHSALDAWDIRDIEYSIGLAGTLNDPSDIDRYWTVEMFIPWKALAQRAHMPVPPKDKDYWRINFSRVHWDTEIINNEYVKIPGKPEYNWVWSPQGLIAMHYPERWGFVVFSHQAPGTEHPEFQIPLREHAKEYLRQLYYLQKQYFMDHGRYARNLRQLKARPFVQNNIRHTPKFETTSRCFHIFLDGKNSFEAVQIRSDGLCR
ncbi:MAG: carbohydrate-binding family 9-like protein [Candidatus Cloacimonadaceae bacterium]|nr:carbohydrate-binding family 9-like protein [Candidatus Cloacimonadaceae bacterium]